MKDEYKTLVGIGAIILIAVFFIWMQWFWLLALIVLAGGLRAIAEGKTSFMRVAAGAAALILLVTVFNAWNYSSRWQKAELENASLKVKFDTMAAQNYPELEKQRKENKRLQAELEEARKPVAPAPTPEPVPVQSPAVSVPAPDHVASPRLLSFEERRQRHLACKAQGKLSCAAIP